MTKPQTADQYLVRGWENYAKGQFAEAIVDFSKAIEINPNDIDHYLRKEDAYEGRANAKGDLEDYVGAVSDFSKVIELNPKDEDTFLGDAYLMRGISKVYLEDYESAFSDFNKAIELNPKDAEAYYYLRQKRGYYKNHPM